MNYVDDGYLQVGYTEAAPYVDEGYVAYGYIESPNNDIIITPTALFLTIAVNEVSSDRIIEADSNTISISANAPTVVYGYTLYTGTETVDTNTHVYPSTAWLRTRIYYERPIQSAYVKAKKDTLKISVNQPSVRMAIYAGVMHLSMFASSSMAQKNIKRFVTKIGDVELDYPMYFDDNDIIRYDGVKERAIDNSTVMSILPIGRFGRSITISGQTFIIDEIKAIPFDDEVILTFRDGSTEAVMFDILNAPLSIEEIANNYYDVTLKVLI